MRIRQIVKIGIGLVLLVVLFMPSFTLQTNAYQEGLWTSDNEFTKRHTGTTFRFGETVEGIVPWERIRMGFPLQPITIDYQSVHQIVQARVEWEFIFFNLVVVSIIGILVWVIIVLSRHIIRHFRR